MTHLDTRVTSGGGYSISSIESLNISLLGKETDKALAEALRQVLRKPAEEAGNLLGDWIGLAGDRIRLKRELNASLGMKAVRKKLELDNVELKNITPPKEEELHRSFERLIAD